MNHYFEKDSNDNEIEKDDFIDPNEFGSDIFLGGEDDQTKIYDFIKETLENNKVPVLIKKDNKIYLFTREDIFQIINEYKVRPEMVEI